MTGLLRRVGLCCFALAFAVSATLAADPAAKTADSPKAKTETKSKATGDSKCGGKKAASATPTPGKLTQRSKVEKADASKKGAESSATPPATVTLKRRPLRITVELEGVFEGDSAQEISLHPDEWSTLVVDTAVQHGATVRKGDVLLKLETDKLDRAIADAQTDLKITEVAFRQVQQQLDALEKTTPVELAAARRAARVAAEDQKFFEEVAKPFSRKAAAFQLQLAKQDLEYQQEELRQLEKMYKADDITEETEEIVLRRARDTVARAKFGLEMAQLTVDHSLKFELPRREEEVNEAAKRTALEAQKREIELPLTLTRLRLERDKLRTQQRQSEEKLARMQADRAAMTIVAPIDGIVYYGKLSRGKPADVAGIADLLRPHVGVPANQVLMTVIEPRPMAIRTTVPENQLHDLRPGLSATATPTGYPDQELSAAIDTVSDIPISPGAFDGRLTVDLGSKTKLLRPGMTCKLKLVPYRKADAICVPPKALITDEEDEHKQSVQVLDKDGKIATRSVTVGRKTDKDVEILKGLEEGEKVVLEPKTDDKS